MSRINTSPGRIKAVHGWLTWFWLVNIPPVVALYVMVDDETFQRLMLLYLAILSIWANVASHFTGWIASRADEAVEG